MMSSYFLVLAAVSVFTFIFLLNLLFTSSRRDPKKIIPNGSMGFLPVIGESLSFIQAQKANRGEEWINERVSKFGPIFKTSIVGSPTIIITGHAGTKFILGADPEVLAPRQPLTIAAIMGKHNLFEISVPRYKFLKGAMMNFLKPESLQGHIKHMDTMIKSYIETKTKGANDGEMMIINNTMNFMKKLTFHIACNILFGLTDGATEEALYKDFGHCFEAIWSVPFNFPGTTFRRGVQARESIISKILPLMEKRKEQLKKGTLNPKNDVLTCMLALKSDDGSQEPATQQEIVDNFISLMIASHDSSAVVLTWMVWKLAKDPKIYENILKEQMSIISERSEKGDGEGKLTWGEIQKMKYTWRVVQELMRVIPPFFGSFRKALKDTSYGGYDIPKGWQVFFVSFGTHMNEDIFNDPTKFDPSRFQNPSKPIPPYAYVPFGGGQHTCIGNEFARVETLIVIHHLVTKFEWSLVNPEETMFRLALPYPSMGLPINLKPKQCPYS